MDVSDRVALAFDGDPELVAAAQTHEHYIAGETLAVEVSIRRCPADAGQSVWIDGRELRVGLQRASEPDRLPL